MNQENNKHNQWPKAFAAIFGIIAISTTAYFTKEPNVMWSMILLFFIIGEFN